VVLVMVLPLSHLCLQVLQLINYQHVKIYRPRFMLNLLPMGRGRSDHHWRLLWNWTWTY